MLRSTVLLFCVILFCFPCLAQEKYVNDFIAAWSVADKTQTERAENTYEILKKEFNPVRLLKAVKELEVYISSNPEERLTARLNMFEVLGKREFSIVLQKKDTLKVAEAIKISRNLKDDQLLAEVYALAADINFEGGYLLYNLKALELQEKIGVEYFSFVQNRYFGASLALYKSQDFIESISYGEKCLTFKNVKVQKWDPMVYIFQLDVIGASQIALKKYDEATKYYQQIKDTVATSTFRPEARELWNAIADGNIGRCFFYKGDFKTAWPLINVHLATALKYQSWNNVAIAENARGAYFLARQDFSKASKSFKNALSAAIQSSKLEDKLKASEGLTVSFAELGNMDSVLHYKKEHDLYLKQQAAVITNGKLSAMTSKILFDNSQRKLEDANSNVERLKLTRNIIIIAIIFFALFTLLFYSRQALKNKLEKQNMVLEHLKTKAEIDKAKASLAQFKNQLTEKEKLIKNLSQSLQKSSLHHIDENLNKSLLSYVLVTDAEWDSFKEDFKKVYPLFYPRLHTVLPNISAAEERLASLILLQMTNKEIANTLGISIDSVARSKRRFKHKLPLEQNDTLESYILAFL